MRILSALLLFICFQTKAQVEIYQDLFKKELIECELLFVKSAPLRDLRLNPKRMWSEILDTLDVNVLQQLNKNGQRIDTSWWRDVELPMCLLVSSREEMISKKYATKKLFPKEGKLPRFYKRQINRFNWTDSYDKNIYSLSRPVFDDSKRYAIVTWSNAHSGLGGGGAIVLYQLKDARWNKIGEILSWKY